MAQYETPSCFSCHRYDDIVPSSPPPQQPVAFTLKANAQVPFFELQVQITFPDQSSPNTNVKALLSITEPHTRISQLIVDALALEYTDDSASGLRLAKIDLHLPNRVRCAGVPAVVSKQLPGSRDCIIGMDILAQGDISISGANRQSLFSFRIPAQGGTDYVELINTAGSAQTLNSSPAQSGKMTSPVRPGTKSGHAVPTGRDQPCPCGSGKKHKNCCGRVNSRSKPGNKNKKR